MDLEVLSEVASATRDKLLTLVRSGVSHPEALAKELSISRTAVDNHLNALVRVGIVERFSPGEEGVKARVFFRLTKDGQVFLEDLRAALRSHERRLNGTFREERTLLEQQFLGGKMDEEAFRIARKKLVERWRGVSGVTVQEIE